MHDCLIASTGRAFARTWGRARRLPLGLIGPLKQRTARLARLQAEVAVLVCQNARADDLCEHESGKVEHLEGAEGDDEHWDVSCKHRLLGDCIRGTRAK